MRVPPSNRAQEEAAAWLSKLGDVPISHQTLRDFQDWRDDPANDLAYTEAEAFWDASGTQAADPEIMRMTAEALARKPRPSLRVRLSRAPVVAALAFASVAVAGLGVLAERQLQPTHATRPIEQKVVRLDDGSRVHLNIGSAVKVKYRAGERRLILTKGEAFFDVAHDPSRPFVVEADGAEIRALGTKFDVRRTAEGLAVTLLQGSVRVSDADAPASVTLAPNQTATVNGRSGHIRTAIIDAQARTSWTTGRLEFRGLPLAEAASEVNRYARRKVVVADPALGRQPMSGYFDVGDSEAFARGAAELFDLEVAAGPNGALRLAPASRAAAVPR